MSPRDELLREMLAAGRQRLIDCAGWSPELSERAKGYGEAVSVVDEWAKMQDAPTSAPREPLVFGGTSCADPAS